MWEDGDPVDVAELVADRLEYLSALSASPRGPADLADAVGSSRSTANRVIRTLEAAGLVRRCDGGYSTTLAGRILTERYERFRDRETAGVMECGPVLDRLPTDCDLDISVLAEASAEVATEPTPSRPREQLRTAIEAADRFEAGLPTLGDRRHFLLWYEHVITDGGTARLAVPRPLFDELREAFPGRLAAMAATDRFTLAVMDPIGYGIAVSDKRALVLAPGTDGNVSGVITNDESAAVDWAQNRLATLFEGATDVTDQLRGRDDRPTHGPPTEVPLPSSLSAEGFVRLTTDYFVSRAASSPEMAWRTGLSLADVHAGYAVDRTSSDDEPFAVTLVAALRDGRNLAVVGPVGAGKSTVCRQVACRWYRDGEPVFYRSGNQGRSFESVDALVDAVAAANGTPLVVVEDAVCPDARAVLGAVDQLKDAGAAVLLDAREEAWYDPPPELDTPPSTVPVEPRHLPALSADDCRRLLERLETTLDASVPLTAVELHEELTDGSARASPQVGVVLVHRIAATATGETRTSIEEAADQLHDDLAEIGERAADAGVLVNLLNAAGIEITPTLVDTVAGADADAVRDRLEGAVLFADPNATAYRTVHESWSEIFLACRVDQDSDDAVQRAARSCERLFDAVGSTELLTGDAAPTEWVCDALERLGDLARRRPKLAPMLQLGTAGIDLPAVVPVDDRVRFERDVGAALTEYGAFDAASAAFDRADRLLDDAPAADRPRHQVRLELARGQLADSRGAYDEALSSFEAAMEQSRTVGDRTLEGECHRWLAVAFYRSGEYDTAVEHAETATLIARESGDDAAIADRLFALGSIERVAGNLSAAKRAHEEAVRRFRELGDIAGESKALANLAVVARDRGELDTAETYFRRRLEYAEAAGKRQEAALALWNLGEVAQRRGAIDAAYDYLDRALDRYDAVDDSVGVANTQVVLAGVDVDAGNYERAIERASEAVETLRDHDDHQGEAAARLVTARAHRIDGSLDAAAAALSDAEAVYDDVGSMQGIVRCLTERGHIALKQGSLDEATDHFRTALDQALDADLSIEAATARSGLARVACERDDHGTARERFTTAFEAYRSAGAAGDALDVVEELIDLCAATGDAAAAVEWCRKGIDVAEAAGDEDSRDTLVERCREFESAAVEVEE